jgi:hypothetical protein
MWIRLSLAHVSTTQRRQYGQSTRLVKHPQDLCGFLMPGLKLENLDERYRIRNCIVGDNFSPTVDFLTGSINGSQPPAVAPCRLLLTEKVNDRKVAISRRKGTDAPDLLDVDQAAGSAAHSVPRAMAGWLGCSLPLLMAGSSHSVLLAVARP